MTIYKFADAYCTTCKTITKQNDNTSHFVCQKCNTKNSLLNFDGTPHPISWKKKEDIQPVLRWVKASEKPLIKKDGNRWEVANLDINDNDFLAALQVHNRQDGSWSWWIRLCRIIDDIGLVVVTDDETEPCGWEIEDIEYYFPISNPTEKESQKQALIDIMEADQRDGMYGVRDNANVNPIWHNGRYRRLASELFSMAADEFSNHGCNDLDPKLLEGWTEPERLQLAIDFENYNVGHLEEFDPNHIFFQDYALMGFFAHLLNIEQEVQECDASKAKSTDEPMAQNTTKEPVIDSEILKEKIVAIIKDCLRIDQNNQVPNYEIAETRLRMAGRMIYRYLKSNSEPVIDWEGLEKIRNYFGEHDKTPFEHWAYTFLNNLLKNQ